MNRAWDKYRVITSSGGFYSDYAPSGQQYDEDLIQMQIACLRHGINKIGIPDLMIAQHAIQNHLELYSRDMHFKLIAQYVPLSLYRKQPG